MAKNLPAIAGDAREPCSTPRLEDPLEWEITTRSRSQRIRWLDGITGEMDVNVGKLREMMADREAWLLQSMGSRRVPQTGRLNNNNLNYCLMGHSPWDLRESGRTDHAQSTAGETKLLSTLTGKCLKRLTSMLQYK